MPEVPNKYQRLRRKLRDRDIDQEYLSKLLGRSRTHVSFCLNGKAEWLMSEVYTIAKICQIPVGEIHIYFPPGGIDKETETKPDPVSKLAAGLAELMQTYITETKKQKRGAL